MGGYEVLKAEGRVIVLANNFQSSFHIFTFNYLNSIITMTSNNMHECLNVNILKRFIIIELFMNYIVLVFLFICIARQSNYEEKKDRSVY